MSQGARASAHSMTGYGRAITQGALGRVTVEMRSTNHRYLEIDQRLPSGLTALQGQLTELVRRHIRRGRVELVVTVQSDQLHQRRLVVNEPLLRRYHEALLELKGRFGLRGGVELEHLLALPQAITMVEDRAPSDMFADLIRRTADGAVKDLVRTRRREGRKLTADLRQQIRDIERLLRRIAARVPRALAEQRRHVRTRLRELLGTRTKSAIAQVDEVVSLLKEVDVHEELVRLGSHLAHMRQALAGSRLVGKQLDFIAQELMRETNTLGAKLNDAGAARHVVAVKGAIEKIREQVQNLE